MDAFLVVVTVLLIWFYLRKSGTIAVDVREEAGPWFESKGIKPSSARHFIYEDPVLVKNPGAVIVVGIAEKEDGDVAGLANVGFVIEVIPSQGVVEGVVLQPYGTATYHKLESQYAKMHGMTLIDRLQQKNKAAQQQNKKAGHTEAEYIGDEESQESQKLRMKKLHSDIQKLNAKRRDQGETLDPIELRILKQHESQKVTAKKSKNLDSRNNSAAHRLQKFLDEPESINPEDNNIKKSSRELFHGGDGLSKNSPVSIDCASMDLAKSYMDVFIKDNCDGDCKRTNLEYTISNPKDSKKLIKVIPVTKPDGTTMEFFFDLSRQVSNLINVFKMFADKDQDDNLDQISGYQVGDNVEVIDGPFSEFDGVIEEVDHENNLLKVDVSIFGRNTSVELKFPQVKKK